HIGYFNSGTAEAAVGDYDAAQADLEAALEIAPASAECAVRINLSFVYEKQADEVAGQDPEQSQELYDRSLKTLEDARRNANRTRAKRSRRARPPRNASRTRRRARRPRRRETTRTLRTRIRRMS